MEETSKKRRSPVFAGFFSFMVPGLGQLYNGEPKRAVAVLALYYLLIPATQVLALSSLGIEILFGLAIVYTLWRTADAARRAALIGSAQLRWYNRWYIYLLFTGVVIVLTSIPTVNIKESYLEAFKIPSSAMADTLVIGDHILVSKGYYRSRQPSRGDIVVFSRPEEPGVSLIKRIIALPGETVELRGKTLTINGQPLDEPYAKYLFGGKMDLGAVTVPEGKLLLLGDNRDQSKDARFWVDAQGNPSPFVDISQLKGRVLYVYWNSLLRWDRVGTSFD
ncbi:MAG: signal peptidase I [Bdellovibrionota bacterium]